MGSPVMTLDAALVGVTHLGLDTAPLIYFIERHPTYIERVRAVVQRIATGTLTGHTSVITLSEVLVKPLRLGQTALAQRYRHFLSHSRNLVLHTLDAAIAERAAELRARYGLRTPDALQIATALAAECTALLTNDRQLQRVTDLRVLVLDELEL